MVFQDLSHTPHNPVHIPPKERDIAMVFQSYALYPHMTVYENMAFGLKLRGMARKDIDARVQRASEILGLQPILDRTPRQLSGGQRQRVALGRALVREPAVFLLDEPLSNLDAKLRLQTRAEISKLHRRLGTTMIYVTHDQIEAMTLGHRIVVLDRGRVQQIDAPLALYNRPANRFVAGFIGSPAMNFIEGQVIAEGGQRVFQSDDGTLTMPVRGDSLATGPATMGIRPEDVRINVGSGPFTVELVEPIGNEVFVYLRGGENQIVVRMAPQTLPTPGAPVSVDIDGDKVHLFDRQTGVRM
jgi:multiple sugar transport system ATP-binding protein